MFKAVPRSVLTALLLLGALLPLARTSAAQTVTPVPSLDLKRLLGVWHELARLPSKSEKNCVRDAVQIFASRYKPDQFSLVTSCQTGVGPSDGANANGSIEKLHDGRLKLTYIWPFKRKVWVLALDPSYEWALLGSPNRKSLWILSRAPTLPSATLADINSRAAAQGFDPSKLIVMLAR